MFYHDLCYLIWGVLFSMDTPACFSSKRWQVANGWSESSAMNASPRLPNLAAARFAPHSEAVNSTFLRNPTCRNTPPEQIPPCKRFFSCPLMGHIRTRKSNEFPQALTRLDATSAFFHTKLLNGFQPVILKDPPLLSPNLFLDSSAPELFASWSRLSS